jgi:hypothetical protein
VPDDLVQCFVKDVVRVGATEIGVEVGECGAILFRATPREPLAAWSREWEAALADPGSTRVVHTLSLQVLRLASTELEARWSDDEMRVVFPRRVRSRARGRHAFDAEPSTAADRGSDRRGTVRRGLRVAPRTGPAALGSRERRAVAERRHARARLLGRHRSRDRETSPARPCSAATRAHRARGAPQRSARDLRPPPSPKHLPRGSATRRPRSSSRRFARSAGEASGSASFGHTRTQRFLPSCRSRPLTSH